MKTIGLLAGPVLGLAIYLWNPGGHPPEARRLLGILVVAICFWVTEAIPLPATALLASALAIITGVAPAKAVLAPYADPVIFLFIGSFLLAEAFGKYGLDLRIAGAMMRSRRFGHSPAGLVAGFGVASAGISTCLSNTATAAVMTPIAVGAVRRAGEGLGAERAGPLGLGDPADGRLRRVGRRHGHIDRHSAQPAHRRLPGTAGRSEGQLHWLAFGVPVALVLLVLSIFWTRLALRSAMAGVTFTPSTGPTTPETAEATAGRRWTILALALAGLLWILPGIASALLGTNAGLTKELTRLLPESAVALLCASLLFVAPVNWREHRFALTWTEGRQVNWGIILLFGGGLSLGTLAEATGLARWAGEGVSHFTSTPAELLAVSVAAAILISEFASNTASVTLLVPLVIAAAQASGFDPVRPALGAGLAATCGFVFPVSTPPNAIVFGTGLVPLWRMIRVGILIDLSSFFVIWLGMLALTPLLPR
jgi:solute carrier family 13 (sodium-dependent dicarboxylate transporter), member 2/3/5